MFPNGNYSFYSQASPYSYGLTQNAKPGAGGVNNLLGAGNLLPVLNAATTQNNGAQPFSLTQGQTSQEPNDNAIQAIYSMLSYIMMSLRDLTAKVDGQQQPVDGTDAAVSSSDPASTSSEAGSAEPAAEPAATSSTAEKADTPKTDKSDKPAKTKQQIEADKAAARKKRGQTWDNNKYSDKIRKDPDFLKDNAAALKKAEDDAKTQYEKEHPYPLEPGDDVLNMAKSKQINSWSQGLKDAQSKAKDAKVTSLVGQLRTKYVNGNSVKSAYLK